MDVVQVVMDIVEDAVQPAVVLVPDVLVPVSEPAQVVVLVVQHYVTLVVVLAVVRHVTQLAILHVKHSAL